MTLKKILTIYIFSLLFGVAFILIKPGGENLSQISEPFQVGPTTLLPDLAPFAIYDLMIGKLANGRTILKFSASFVNKGKSHFELIGSTTSTGSSQRNVNQRIIAEDGSTRDKLVGNFEWHAAHDHYHYGDFADYVFGSVRLLSTDKAPIAIRQKTTFCLRDNELAMPELAGAPKIKAFAYCTQTRQGVSVGWTDIYDYKLPDQYIDVHDMPAGIYSLSFFLDPNQRFVEEQKDNNISTVFFELNPAKKLVRFIAASAPFATSRNNFPDQLLIKGEDAKVFVMHNNKKRWIRTDEIFNSYSYSWDNVYNLSQSNVDAIPFNNLMRVKDALEVYAVNDLGYRRHVANPDIFNSYGFSWTDIAEISPTEFQIYTNSGLIMLSGESDVYSIDKNTKKRLGNIDTIRSLGYNPDAIQTINQTDFDTYTTLP